MRSKIKKFEIVLLLLAVAAGIIFLSCGFCGAVPKNVEINGVAVGGKPYEEAAAAVRADIEENLKDKKLQVSAGGKTYTFSFPEISYKDDLYRLVRRAKKGDRLTANVSYYLCGINDICENIAQSDSVPVVEPYADFVSTRDKTFIYYGGNDGKEINLKKLKSDILSSLKGGFERVEAEYITVPRKQKLSSVKEKTKLLNKFTTKFDGDNVSRSSNIRLAAAKLNGTVLESGKTLSFNHIVGARTKERGFLSAKIIQNGTFTEGVGGGVCQVSTTLYNAALLSGLKIEEFHPHSLAVSYVPPSRDAMVSGTYFDLKISNPFDCPVYIRALSDYSSVTFEIYGLGDGAKYILSSEVTGSIPAPEEECDDPSDVRTGRDGTESKGYLTVIRDGYKKTGVIRKDKYQPVKRVKLKNQPVEEDGAEEEINR